MRAVTNGLRFQSVVNQKSLKMRSQICADTCFEKYRQYTPDFEKLIYIFGFDNLILQFSEADRPMFRETKFLI